jgi:two-component system OmpR family sensor kinase
MLNADHVEVESLRVELQERDDILAMAGHELRNPLHALTMQLTLARTTAEHHGQADTVARLMKAEATLARYVDRVTVLMDLIRGQAADYPLSVRAFDLSEVLRNLVDSMSGEARFRGVQVKTELPAKCPAWSDPLVVEQVIDNLLLNALKHAACTEVTIRLRHAGHEAEIDVQDNGRGISEHDQQRIFGKAMVAEQGQRGAGTGLGLWIVRKLLATLGGSISLNSQPGAGTVFNLRFPMTHMGGNRP